MLCTASWYKTGVVAVDNIVPAVWPITSTCILHPSAVDLPTGLKPNTGTFPAAANDIVGLLLTIK